MARTKYSERFCGFCNKSSRMELIGEMQNSTEKIWYKCSRCHHMTLVDVKMDEQNRTKDKADSGSAALYNPEQTFTVGQSIFPANGTMSGKSSAKPGRPTAVRQSLFHLKKLVNAHLLKI